MKNSLMAVFVAILALGLSIGNAEAARLGGSKSFGMQRQSLAPRPASPAQAAPAAPSAPVGAPAAAPKRNWLGPLAGLAAGLGIAALLSKFGMGAGMANILMIALLAMAAVFVFKWLFRRNAAVVQPAGSLQYAGGSCSAMTPTPPQAVPSFGSSAVAATPSAQRIPADFDTTAFLRIAKLNFVRLQASNDAKNLDDIREFVSPELFAEIKMQMDERGNAPQQTDVVTLNADLLEVTTESHRHIASVHFSGTISEVVSVAAAPFDEIWNLSKSVDGNGGWIVAGIQQLN
jgi:predicted lipid-binding transport protein (Tim44 family)